MNKNKKKIIVIILSCFLFVFFMTLFINIYMVNSSKERIVDIDKVQDINDIDAIIILGCKTEDGMPSLMLSNRLEQGFDVYQKLHTKIIVTGDNTRDDYDEVNVMEKVLIEMGIPQEDIYKDYAGINTYNSIYRAKNVFNVKKIVIITQEYHMYRVLYLANKLDLEAYGVVASDIPQKFIMLKNKIREVFARDKNFFVGIFKPESKYNDVVINYSEVNYESM